ncbi:MAG TPA: mannose-1-phosphate guanylyltransferase [Opitutaceae bacterium]|nr:mannose-1-phosphate guanylyltransferase [Opitutaceae bacterium]
MVRRYVVILAGGKGERFWPQSRLRRPKQLLPIVGDRPMLRQTLERVLPVLPPANVLILTNAEQAAAVRRLCPEVPRDNVVAEPVGRDSGPAVGLAAHLVAARDPAAVFASLHSDAAIHDVRAFQRDLRAAFAAAEAAPVIVLIGVPPTEPATAYGYIQRGEPWRTLKGRVIYQARRFVEKPTLEVAQGYLAAGDYYWNPGIFVWRAGVVLDAFARHSPAVAAGLAKIGAALARRRPLAGILREAYPLLPKIAVDYAILEKADNVVVFPATFDWDDVGSWTAISRHCAKDTAGNVILGRAIVEEGSHNIVINDDRHFTAVLGADHLVVVHTPDATLVCTREKAGHLKRLLKRLEADPHGRTLL